MAAHAPTLAAHAVDLAPPDIARWQKSACGVDYVHTRVGAAPGPDVLVTALAHGNEYSGAWVVSELLDCGWQPGRGRVTFAFCNACAFARFDAGCPDASRFIDEDFNRVWMDARLDSDEHSIELTRARQIRPFVQRATHVLDLHSMHEPAPPLLLAGLLPRNIAFAQALQTAAQVIIDAGHADGVRLRDYGSLADAGGDRIALLLEAGQHWDARSITVARNTTLRFLIAAGVCDRSDAPAGWLLPDHTPPPPVHVTERVVARTPDFEFTSTYSGGEIIARAGTVIARDAGRDIVTPYDDCMLVMPSTRQLRPGVTTVRLGQRVTY